MKHYNWLIIIITMRGFVICPYLKRIHTWQRSGNAQTSVTHSRLTTVNLDECCFKHTWSQVFGWTVSIMKNFKSTCSFSCWGSLLFHIKVLWGEKKHIHAVNKKTVLVYKDDFYHYGIKIWWDLLIYNNWMYCGTLQRTESVITALDIVRCAQSLKILGELVSGKHK